MKELTINELHEINGGKTFAYRVGQACAIMYDLGLDGTPYLDTSGGINAVYDWFY